MAKNRQLDDRTETYTDTIAGACSCGESVNKTIGSNCTMWKNGDRYHYPESNTAWCAFSCRNCKQPVHETFKPYTDGD